MMRLFTRAFAAAHSRVLWQLPVMLALIAAMPALAADDDDSRVRPNYKAAQKYNSAYLRQFSYSTSVRPGWINETDRFWYRYRTSDGWFYYIVDPDQRTKEHLFDREKMAAALSVVTTKAVDPADVGISELEFSEDEQSIRFEIDEQQYEFNLLTEELSEYVEPEEPEEEDAEGEGNGEEEQQQEEQQEEEQQEEERDDEQDEEKEEERDQEKKDEEEHDEKEHDEKDVEEKDDDGEQEEEHVEKKDDEGETEEKQDEQKQEEDDQEKTELEQKTDEQVKKKDEQEQEKQEEDDDQEKKLGDKQEVDEKNDEQQEKEKEDQDQDDTKKDDTEKDEDEEDEDESEEDDEEAKRYRNYSPDEKTYVFAMNHNLYFAEEGKEDEAIQLTDDGEDDYGFGSGDEEDEKVRARVTWSEDSEVFYVTRRDSRGVAELFLVNTLAEPRPTLESYKYPMPGEENVRKSELYLFDRSEKNFYRVEPRWKDESYRNLHWGQETSDELRFARRDRLQRNLDFCSLNTTTGECTVLFSEAIQEANLRTQSARYIEDRDDMIWWSERTGWAHFYRYDRQGKLKNAITSGSFMSSRIVDIDTDKGLMYFTANGREPGENVYNTHLYKVYLDGTGLVLLDPGNANHRSTLSPSKKYLVDNCSRVDMAPVSYLRDTDGNLIMELETTDLSRLEETGWQMPETFIVKAADGVTDLYGNMWKPFDFDPGKKYPIIAHVYPGPQTEGVTHTFSATGGGRQELAQIGFIVIQVGHRGGSPQRNKAYSGYGYYNLRDYGLADKKAAIEQLAARHDFINIERVGIYGHSGGGFMTAAALLREPYNEFFTAGVASAGNHDNNIYNSNWSEQYHGLREVEEEEEENQGGERAGRGRRGRGIRGEQNLTEEQRRRRDEFRRRFEEQNSQQRQQDEEQQEDEQKEDEGEKEKTTRFEIHVPTNAELAANLKGALLLVHGEVDNNVHPGNTIRLVNALIKANKRFDMLIMPGKRHGFGDQQRYFTQRMWEFFAEHLLGDHQTGADIYEKD